MRTLAFAIAAFLLFLLPNSSADSIEKPNIILISIDTLLTTPAHMSIFTSLTPNVHKVVTIRSDRFFRKENGYLTFGLHGGAELTGSLGFDKGFDLYRQWGGYEQWRDLQELPKMLDSVQEAIKKSKLLGKPVYPKDMETKIDPNQLRKNFWNKINLGDQKQKDRIISLYDGGIYYSDYIFGELVKIFKEEKYYDNSIIILVSDHGEEFYEHKDKLHWRLFIETLHVPLIFKFPGNKYGGSIRSLIFYK